jgi:hypothetical protein
MNKFIDLSGNIYGRLTVIKFDCVRNNKVRWICKCICGNEKSILAHALKSKETKSCGCLAKDNLSKISKTHGLSRTPEYRAWIAMKERCYSVNADSYNSYGGRGIIVYEGWINDFKSFLSHVGKKPSKLHSLDRIDTDGNYEPNNVRWATTQVQNNNKRSNRYITDNGITKTVTEWASYLKLSKGYFCNLLKKGIPLNEIITHSNKKSASTTKYLRW